MKRNIVTFLIFSTVLIANLISCSKSDSPDTSAPAANACAGTPGPLFSAVKTLMTAKCVSCHNGSNANGGMNFSVECNIVSAKTRIKTRAVDEGTMPPGGTLPQSDKNTITAWVNAGGRITD